MPQSPIVRPARRGEAAVIAAVHVASWRVAYRGLLPDEYLDRLSTEDRLPFWEELLAAPLEPGHHLLVVEDQRGEVAGFAIIVAAEPAELRAIYLHPDAWGRRLGLALHDHALAVLAEAGCESVELSVHPGNERALRFYERAGWIDDGVEQTEVVWGVESTERRHRRALRRA